MEAELDQSSSRSTTKQQQHKDNAAMVSAQNTRRRRRCICLWVTGVILGLGLLFLILGLTVFKPKRPVTIVNSVSIENLDFSLDILRLRVLLNFTLDVGITVKNPNSVGFKYTDSTAFLRYRGDDVGEASVPAGKIGAHSTRSMNLTLTLMADRLLSNSALYSDAISGKLPFQTYIRMAGKVRILFSIHVVTYTTCDFQIDISKRTISDQKCHYKTKL